MHTPKLHRFFERWLKENRHRFLARPFISDRTHDRILVGFEGYPKIIKAEFGKDASINVMVMKKKWQIFDFLAAGFENFSVRSSVGGGEVVGCSQCEETFKTIEDYFERHVFEEFLLWTNEELAGARYLLLETFECGSNNARLAKEMPGDFKGEVIEMRKRNEGI